MSEFKEFKHQMHREQDVNYRSQKYYIAEKEITCHECNRNTPVFCFILPEWHEELFVDACDRENDEWVKQDYATILEQVSCLFETVAERASERSNGKFFLDKVHAASKKQVWMNHCANCGTRIHEEVLTNSREAAFVVSREEDAERITLHAYDEPFGCKGTGMFGDIFVEYMNIVYD